MSVVTHGVALIYQLKLKFSAMLMNSQMDKL